MKNLSITACATFSIALFISGCGQSTVETSDANLVGPSPNTVATEGCCGKCSGEAIASAEPQSGCCGKCQEPSATKTEASPVSCENGCNACAEGNSENCKCGDGVGEGKATKTAHVNSMPEDRDIFHYLLESHQKITRTVKLLDNGVETLTESTDPAVASKIKEHVASMKGRVEDGRPLRMWDDLYREIFKHADKIEMEIKDTENGISVVETSDDEYVVKLIQAHAKVVTGFKDRGFEEARENHTPPNKK